MRVFHEQLGQANQPASILAVLEQLFHVFAIHTLRNGSTDFIRVYLYRCIRMNPCLNISICLIVQTVISGSNP